MPALLPALATIALVIALTALARRLPIPTPIVQVAAGALIGLLPGVTVPHLDPHVVFFIFLPPILWAAAFFTSLREFRANIRPISLLAVGLVLATTVIVAVVAKQLLPGIPWAVAVALGAIVSPPDAVAAAAIVSRLPVPRRVIVILEGESLVNDASALVLYRTAVAAAVTGVFSWGESVVRFFIDAGVGTMIGLAVGWLIIWTLARTKDALAETLATLAGPYIAWVAAETVHVSAVLASVAGGLYVRQHLSTVVGPISRIEARAVWDLFIFLLNALIFLILGAQFGEIVAQVPPESLGTVALAGLLIGVVMMAVRLVWVPVATYLPRWMDRDLRRREPAPQWKPVALVSWTAMRGIVSLATALALPFALADGSPFPYRSEIIVITMVVIVLTLAVQGFSLAPIIRWMKFEPEHGHHAEELLARREMARRAAEALEDQAREPGIDRNDVDWLRMELGERHREAERGGGTAEGRGRLRLGMIAAQRRMLVRLRNEGAIGDEVLLTLERELDLDEIRAGASESP
ncbi:MAG: Na+/H+ antiporter [Gemmatimonadaceae bacterium]|nr:Na+/H+ antiporter [Gemmatimonadaceae bacterium]